MSLAVYVNAPVGDKEPVTWVATGQQALANTFVWDASNMQTLAVLQTGQKSINMYVPSMRQCSSYTNLLCVVSSPTCSDPSLFLNFLAFQ